MDELTKAILIGELDECAKLTELELHNGSDVGDVVGSMDKAIEHMNRVWYDMYDWSGAPRYDETTISERDMEKAWDSYEKCYTLIAPAIRTNKKLRIGTGTFCSDDKEILQTDLHLRLSGYDTTLLGYSLTPEALMEQQDSVDVFVLSISEHNKQFPALTTIKDIIKTIQKPVFVNGKAFLAIDAWYSGKSTFKPSFMFDVPKASKYEKVADMTKGIYGFDYVGDINALLHDLANLPENQ